MNVTANVGYILNSNPRSDAFGGGEVTLLDRPDELITGIGFDFPLNKRVQPMVELKWIRYTGGATRNALPNNPFDVIGGLRFFLRRNVGVAAAYRRHLNPQHGSAFNDPLPNSFAASDSPHGFIFQFFAGKRNARERAILRNQPPSVELAASVKTITSACSPNWRSHSGQCPLSATTSVQLMTSATDPDGDMLLYTYTVNGGRIKGEGANVSWDLSGVGPGTYTASVDVDDGCGCITSTSTTIRIANCPDCYPISADCPTIASACPDVVDSGQPLVFTAMVGVGIPPPTGYKWSVSAGTITSGQGTTSIVVDTSGLGGQSITATLEVIGFDPSCPRTTSCTTAVRPPIIERHHFDEYGNIRFNDEKARLDNFAIQLQNEPTAQGYIVAYGACKTEGPARGNRAKGYLVHTRGLDARRVIVIDGGCLPELLVQLWIVPQGDMAPTGNAVGVISPCPDCKKPLRRRGSSRRKRR